MKKEHGAVFVELLLVLPILFIILAAGFEISRLIRFKNAAIQLSYQAANEAFRECASEKAILMKSCVTRVQRDMTQFAMQISPDEDGSGASYVAITVFFNFDNDDNPNTPSVRARYTARPDASETELGQNNNFASKYAVGGVHGGQIIGTEPYDWNALENGNNDLQLLLNSLDQVVVAQAYVKYKPIGLLLGGERIFTDNYITDYTIL